MGPPRGLWKINARMGCLIYSVVLLLLLSVCSIKEAKNVTQSPTLESTLINRTSTDQFHHNNNNNNSYTKQEEVEMLQEEDSILSAKLMSFANRLSTTTPNNTMLAIKRLRSPRIQPRLNPLAPLLALLRILLLPLRILLAPVIVLLRALIQILRLLLRLLNPIFLLFVFLGAVNMVANIARIVALILRIIFEALRRRRRKDKDEYRDVEVVTIVEDQPSPPPTTTMRPVIYFAPKPKPKPPHKPNHHRPSIKQRKPQTRKGSPVEDEVLVDQIMERERLIINRLLCFGALTAYPRDRPEPPTHQWLMQHPQIHLYCGGALLSHVPPPPTASS